MLDVEQAVVYEVRVGQLPRLRRVHVRARARANARARVHGRPRLRAPPRGLEPELGIAAPPKPTPPRFAPLCTPAPLLYCAAQLDSYGKSCGYWTGYCDPTMEVHSTYTFMRGGV